MTEHPDDDNWQDHDDDDEASNGENENAGRVSPQANNDLNALVPDELTVPKSSDGGSHRSVRSISGSTVSSKSTRSSTRRKNRKLRLEIERLRRENAKLRSSGSSRGSSTRSGNRKSRNGGDKKHSLAQPRNMVHHRSSHNNSDDGSHDSTLTKSTRSSTRRENEGLRLENDRIRSELAELKETTFEALLLQSLQTSGVPSAAPVPDVAEVEVFCPADQEELLLARVDRLTNLVQALLSENEDLRFQLEKLFEGSGGGSVSSSATVSALTEPSPWGKLWSTILVSGAILLVTGATMTHFGCSWPVSRIGRHLRIAHVMFQNGLATDVLIEMVPKVPVRETLTRSLEEAITGMLHISQNGVGLAEFD